MSGQGLFITLEGGEGTGKSGIVRRLTVTLGDLGVDILATKEPGDSHIGAEIRALLLGGTSLDPRTEALLMAADRAEHVATVVRPALEAGKTVVCDRFMDSSVAYQGVARGLGVDEIRDISLWASAGLVPDLTILLDLDPAVGAARRSAAGDVNRLDLESQAFHERVREGFLDIAGLEPSRFRVVNAAHDRDQVFAEVLDIVRPMVEGHYRIQGACSA